LRANLSDDVVNAVRITNAAPSAVAHTATFANTKWSWTKPTKTKVKKQRDSGAKKHIFFNANGAVK